ncbi:MAG: formyltransferase family protein [Candidatus Limivicinus sp.]|jgi:phosphoribosylglycinamide formyltransferase-1|nr:formyltransferase family protein [Candidatus Limivicinus sp.]MDY5083066.1 formyltransferase family protein [Candidatus Limivicinus sp.]
MVRAAALVSGDGAKLQAILDSMYFKEIPDFELVAVISSEKDAYAMKRALNAGVPAYVVDPELFPNMTSHSMAVANKLKDMDIELVILAGYDMPLGVIPYQFKNHIIGTFPALYPAFEDAEGDVQRAVLERGVKITGATAYFADADGRVGGIILQRAIEVMPDDTPDSLRRRVLEDAEWKLLSQAVSLYCANRLSIRGNRVIIEAETVK